MDSGAGFFFVRVSNCGRFPSFLGLLNSTEGVRTRTGELCSGVAPTSANRGRRYLVYYYSTLPTKLPPALPETTLCSENDVRQTPEPMETTPIPVRVSVCFTCGRFWY